MASEMVDRVARAMMMDELSGGLPGRKRVERDPDEIWEAEGAIWLSNARAAIEAMRDLNDAMIAAWADSYRHLSGREQAKHDWQAMIDAALA